MTTLDACSSLRRRTRSTILAGAVALSTLLAPVGVAIAQGPDEGPAAGSSGYTIPADSHGDLTGLTARISTGGGGLNLRANPSLDADVVATLADGTVVSLRVDMLDTVVDANGTRWWPVEADGRTGWVSGFYLADPGTDAVASSSNVPVFKDVDTAGARSSETSSADDAAPAAEFSWEGASLTDATARVSANGDGLHMRAAPGRDADVVSSIPDGTVVDLRIDMVDTVYDADGVTRWWPVLYDNTPGWVAGSYLVPAQGGDSTGSTASVERAVETSLATEAPVQFDGGTLQDATAYVSADGDQLILRAHPSADADILDRIPDGSAVSLRIDQVDTVYDADGVTRWWPVSWNGQDGWVSGFYLAGTGDRVPTTNESDGTAGSNTPTNQQEPFDWDGDDLGDATATVNADGDGANVRSEPDANSDIVTTVPDGTTVSLRIDEVDSVLDNDGVTRWWPVEVDGATGWMSGGVLGDGSADAVSSGSDRASTQTPTPTTGLTPVPTPSGAETDSPLDDRPTPTPTPRTGTAELSRTPEPTATEEATSAFIAPVEGATITQGFGCSSLGFYPYNADWGCSVHDGMDFAAPAYTPVMASAAGTVVTAGWCNCGLGYYVEIDHGNGVHTIYGHMAAQPYVSVGQKVAQGETIGPVGSTGLSTGPHTHFMVQIDGVSQDPSRFLP